MKRKASPSPSKPAAKTTKTSEPTSDYCDVEPRRAEDNSILWPANPTAISQARDFLRECAQAGKKTLIVPDKDADGLDAGVILYRTLEALGLPSEHIDVHLLEKHASVHSESERQAMQAKEPGYIIVVDHGSVEAPPIIDAKGAKCLIIDHHLSDKFPKDAQVVSACHYPPVATSSLLTYEICKDLHDDIADSCGFLCAMGTHGDLGNTLKWKPPFPDMTQTFKTHTKKAINDAVALVNAPRRTAQYDVHSAWSALLKATSPKDILRSSRLIEARQQINEEVEFRTHTPPKFSKDGKIAVLRIHSEAQVHGPIATRWANYLPSKKLEFVMVANSGYKPGFVNFSCRVARLARYKDPPVNIIQSLLDVAALDEGDLKERMGESFARGHKEASGGIIPSQEFEELMTLMRIGEKPDPVEGESKGGGKKTVEKSPQKNNLMNYFGKKAG